MKSVKTSLWSLKMNIILKTVRVFTQLQTENNSIKSSCFFFPIYGGLAIYNLHMSIPPTHNTCHFTYSKKENKYKNKMNAALSTIVDIYSSPPPD